MQITEHFHLDEFACKDGTPYPNLWIASRLLPLCRELEILRAALGDAKITITSGYRSPAHNRNVGGASRSLHVQGKAVDLQIDGYAPQEVADCLTRLMDEGKIRPGGIGRYNTWTHFDRGGTRAAWGHNRRRD